jgi:hypothetical protein
MVGEPAGTYLAANHSSTMEPHEARGSRIGFSRCAESQMARPHQEPVGLRCSIAKHRFNINRARARTDFDDFMQVKEAAHIGNM